MEGRLSGRRREIQDTKEEEGAATANILVYFVDLLSLINVKPS